MPSTSSGIRAIALASALAAIGLAGALVREHQRTNALARRVDSVVVTVTTLAKRDGGSRPPAVAFAAVSDSGAATMGASDAPVTVVEFTDYQCPFCARHASTTLPELKARYIVGGKVRYVVRDLPLPIHAYARAAAIAARCIATSHPDQYWAFHDSLFVNQKTLDDPSIHRFAAAAGADRAAFRRCLESPEVQGAIARDEAVAQRAGFSGTPAFVIGRVDGQGMVKGRVLLGAYPAAEFNTIIDSLLAGKS